MAWRSFSSVPSISFVVRMDIIRVVGDGGKLRDDTGMFLLVLFFEIDVSELIIFVKVEIN